MSVDTIFSLLIYTVVLPHGIFQKVLFVGVDVTTFLLFVKNFELLCGR